MATLTERRADLDDLLREEGKAELVGGKLIRFMPNSRRHNRSAGRIYRSLAQFAENAGRGEAFTDGMGFAVAELSSGRESFSPDVGYHPGPLPEDDSTFVFDAPTFAVEVRGESDRGPAAELARSAKRADYFEAGTLVVWDVEPEHECVHIHRASAPDVSETLRGEQFADAEPAVPGWRMAVAEIFRR